MTHHWVLLPKGSIQAWRAGRLHLLLLLLRLVIIMASSRGVPPKQPVWFLLLEKTPFTFELKSFKKSNCHFKSRYSSLEAYNWCLDKLTFYYWIVYGNVVKIVENILLRKWIEKDYLEPILICSIALEVRIILILLTAGKVILSIGYFLLVVWVITFSN